jgi:hypothetical protein
MEFAARVAIFARVTAPAEIVVADVPAVVVTSPVNAGSEVAATESVPPRVKLPLPVTLPVKVKPLTVPVPETLVTVPTLVVYPLGLVEGYAPRAVSAADAEVAPVPPFAIGRAVPLNPIASVPLTVTGDPVTERNAGTDKPTLVTVPEPPAADKTPPLRVNPDPTLT